MMIRLVEAVKMGASEIAAWSAGVAGVLTAVVSGLVMWSKQAQSERSDAALILKDRLEHTEKRLDVAQQKIEDCEHHHAETKSQMAVLTVMAEDCNRDRADLRRRVELLEDTVRLDDDNQEGR